MIDVNIEANSLDPDLDVHCLPRRLQKHFSRRHSQTAFAMIGALLRLNATSENGEDKIIKQLM